MNSTSHSRGRPKLALSIFRMTTDKQPGSEQMTQYGLEKKGSEGVACTDHWADERADTFRDWEFTTIRKRRKTQLMLW